MFAGKESSVIEGLLCWLTFGVKVAEEYLQVIALVSLPIKSYDNPYDIKKISWQ
jgi:hypothetical protein